MAKSFPIHTDRNRFDSRWPLAVPSAVIVRDGVVVTRGERDSNPVMMSESGKDCCCGDGKIPCGFCCRYSFLLSNKNCCYSYFTFLGDDGSKEIELVNLNYSFEDKQVHIPTGETWNHVKMVGTQSAPSKFAGEVQFVCEGSCFFGVTYRLVIEDFLRGTRDVSFPTLGMCAGPRKDGACPTSDRFLWRVRVPAELPIEDCFRESDLFIFREPNTNQKTQTCFGVTESFMKQKVIARGSRLLTITWSMSFNIILKTKPCKAKCIICTR